MNLLGEILYGRIDRKPYALRVSIMEMIRGYGSFLVINLLTSSYGGVNEAPALFRNIFGIIMLIIYFFELILSTKRCRDMGLPGWLGTLGLLASSLFLGMAGTTVFLVILMVVPTDFVKRKK